MAEQKRRRKSVVEAEALEQARQLAPKHHGFEKAGNPGVQQVKAQIDEHNSGKFRYYPELAEELVSYFADAEAWWTNYNDSGTGKVLPKGMIPTFERFARTKRFSKFSMYDWCEKHPEFARAYAEAVELQKAFIIEGAAANAIPAQFAVFMLKCNHGMMEPQAGDTDGENDNVSMQVNGKGQTA